MRLIETADASLKKNTIHGTVWDLATRLPEKVYKPSRGLFRLVEFRDKNTDQLKADLVRKPPKKTKEEDFYLVPEESPQDEIARLDSLCQVFGIGLILFDVASPNDPKFKIRVRARKQEPDMFYANKYMRLIETEMWS